MIKKTILLSLLAFLLSACTVSPPRDAQIESLVRESLLTDGLGDLFALENFAKTNGFRQSDNIYIADVEYELVFQKSFIDVVREKVKMFAKKKVTLPPGRCRLSRRPAERASGCCPRSNALQRS